MMTQALRRNALRAGMLFAAHRLATTGARPRRPHLRAAGFSALRVASRFAGRRDPALAIWDLAAGPGRRDVERTIRELRHAARHRPHARGRLRRADLAFAAAGAGFGIGWSLERRRRRAAAPECKGVGAAAAPWVAPAEARAPVPHDVVLTPSTDPSGNAPG